MIELLVLGVLLVFGFVILYGAPYVPTLKPQAEIAFELLDLKPGQTLLELGSGDGRVMRQAARRGLHVVGYELNPFLVLISRIVTWRYRRNVRIICGNFWIREWPPSDGAFVFLLNRWMPRLDAKIKHEPHHPKKLVSYAFEIPGKKPFARRGPLFLYHY